MKSLKKTTVIGILLVIIPLVFTACYYGGGDRIEGEGSVITRELDLGHFSGISVHNSAKIILTQGDRQHVEVEGQENVIRNLNQEITGNIWKIKNMKPIWRYEKLIIRITLPELSSIRISGSADVSTTNNFDNLDDVEFRISGSGSIDLKLKARDVFCNISGSGDIRLRGEANGIEVSISGSGDIYADELMVKKASARISGSGGVNLYVTNRLDASISGSGDINYKGHPTVDSRVTGSGHVHSR